MRLARVVLGRGMGDDVVGQHDLFAQTGSDAGVESAQQAGQADEQAAGITLLLRFLDTEVERSHGALDQGPFDVALGPSQTLGRPHTQEGCAD